MITTDHACSVVIMQEQHGTLEVHAALQTCLSQSGLDWQAAAEGIPTRNSCTIMASLPDPPSKAICLPA